MPTETDNKVQFGLQNVHIAALKDDGTYDAPVKIPGAVNLSTSPEGDSSVFYADNIPYYTAITNAGYTGDLEMALIPDSAKVIMGLGFIDSNGAFVEDADLVPKPYALLFEVKGDVKNRRNAFYNCSSSRPETENATTEDSTDVSTETLPITMIPKSIGGKNITKLSIPPTTANQAVYDKFFTEVIEPNATAA